MKIITRNNLQEFEEKSKLEVIVDGHSHPSNIKEWIKDATQQAVEAERKRILDSLPEYGLYNHKLHRHRWSKEGFNDCLSKVRDIILNTNN